MPEDYRITSTKNPKIREAELLLTKSRERKKQGKFLIEGDKEVTLALQANITLSHFFFLDSEDVEIDARVQALRQKGIVGYACNAEVLQKISYRSTGSVLILVAKHFSQSLYELALPEKPLILVVEAVEKPGNLGAMLRTADAVGVDAMIFCDLSTEIVNPTVIRASLGTLFTVPWVQAEGPLVQAFLEERKIPIYVSDLEGAVSYLTPDYAQGCALVMGTEATGITDAWRQCATERIKIPMAGAIDSMNVSVAAAILLFEAARQRQ